ncbi:MAG: hypothetical protein AB1607_16485 [Chloroflexota bacterium]
MNIKCSFCQTPYTLSRMEMLDALQEMDAGKLNHYDAHCPRCRRATPVQRSRMEVFFPNWREALKQFEAEMKAHPQQEAPLPAPEAVSVPSAESKPVQAPAKDKPAKESPSRQKPASQPKATAKKPESKKAPAKKKK